MISFFKDKEKNKPQNNSYSKIAALLIHAAKIDEAYEKKEEGIIREALIDLGSPITEIDKIMSEATIIEENSNQILDFTREVKNVPDSDKIKIIESLWKIIYSNDSADIYETNLMRRLSGLLYVDAKIMGDLKLKVKSELGK
jgi:uncharacterized tellurite resistance protein B-like protein